jgi:alpha-tubulin suppressor-like RCC1 family protein
MDLLAQPANMGSHHRRSAVVIAATVAALIMSVATPASAAPVGALAWGFNLNGQLGDGTISGPEGCDSTHLPCSRIPVQVSGLAGVVAVSAGGHHSLALLSDGTVMAWGENSVGQLGNGTTANSDVPVVVSGLSEVKAISAGLFQSLALSKNGTVMAWGNNNDGQLGNGTMTNSDVPVAVSGLSEVKAISTGAFHSLALLSDGTVMAWGENSEGELGNGTTANSDVPVAVSGVSEATAISAGFSHSLAGLSNGTARAWGDNAFGELGDGTTTGPETCGSFHAYCSRTPIEVSGLSGVTAISADAFDSLALMSNGTVRAWGESATDLPVEVGGLTEVTAIAAGGGYGVALLGNGKVMAWGAENRFGELGDGTTSPRYVPVAVCGVSGAAGISAGGEHSMAYGELVPSCPTVTNVSPNSGAPAGGTTVTIAGANFTEVSAVRFGSTNATSVTVNSPTKITAVSPAGMNTTDVTVITPAGTSPTNSADQFSYGPAVTTISPKIGPAGGGTTVKITGTRLTGATAVKFGSSNAASFTVNSSTSITAMSPAEPTGKVDVTVTTPGGTSPIVLKDLFNFAPVVAGLSPNAGSKAGGTRVTITGSGFALGKTATIIKFGAPKATSVNCESTTTCIVVAPAHAIGTVDVKATVSKATSPANRPADQFTYN